MCNYVAMYTCKSHIRKYFEFSRSPQPKPKKNIDKEIVF